MGYGGYGEAGAAAPGGAFGTGGAPVDASTNDASGIPDAAPDGTGDGQALDAEGQDGSAPSDSGSD